MELFLWVLGCVAFGLIVGTIVYDLSNRLLVHSAEQHWFPSQNEESPDPEQAAILARPYRVPWSTVWRHPHGIAMIVGCGALAGVAVWRFEGHFFQLWGAFLLIATGVLITRTDLIAQLIHNKVVLGGLVLAVVYRSLYHPLPWWDYGIAAILGALLLWMLGVLSNGGMGWGDIKFYVFIGALCGIQVTMLSLFVASLSGLVIGLLLRMTGKLQPKQFIPFGPFIAFGMIVCYLFSDALLQVYWSIFDAVL